MDKVKLQIHKGDIQQIANIQSGEYYQNYVAPNISKFYDSYNTGGIDYQIVESILNNVSLNEIEKEYLHNLYLNYSNYDNRTIYQSFKESIDIENPFNFHQVFQTRLKHVINETKEKSDELNLIMPAALSLIVSLMCLALHTSTTTWQILAISSLFVGYFLHKKFMFNLYLKFNQKYKQLESDIEGFNESNIKKYFNQQSYGFYNKLNKQKQSETINKLINADMLIIRSLITLDKLKNANYDLLENNKYKLGLINNNSLLYKEIQKELSNRQDQVLLKVKTMLFNNTGNVENKNKEIFKLRNTMFLLHPFIISCVSNNQELLSTILKKTENENEIE